MLFRSVSQSRYGYKVYKEVSNTKFRWDGKSNSRVLNSDTYWFVITAGDERIYKGWERNKASRVGA